MYQINSETNAVFPFLTPPPKRRQIVSENRALLSSVLVADSRYTVKLARTRGKIAELLRLRYRVFNVELGNAPENPAGIEADEFDATSHHLIVVENSTKRIVGGYRLRTAELPKGFYSAQEFKLADLPENILAQSVEIGRACIEAEHRNGKVLFLLWKGLAQYLRQTKKRYLFGCCSLFSRDLTDGVRAFNQLEREGHFHDIFRVDSLKPIQRTVLSGKTLDEKIELPKLFTTYLRIGAKVCSSPMVDSEFGTIDFFVLFDSQKINEKYRKMFFA